MKIQNRAKYIRLVRPRLNGAGDQVVLVRKDNFEVRSADGIDAVDADDAEVKKVLDLLKSLKHSYQTALPFRLSEVLAECAEYYAACQSDEMRQFIHDLLFDAYKNVRKADSRLGRDSAAT